LPGGLAWKAAQRLWLEEQALNAQKLRQGGLRFQILDENRRNFAIKEPWSLYCERC
jgi:hypothetical protein